MNLCVSFFRSAAIIGLVALSARAATIKVDNLTALQAAIDRAKAGDQIVVQNGTYTSKAAIMVKQAGTEKAPIIISAETVGGVEIAGTHGFDVVKPAAYIVISGFKFTHAAGHETIAGGTSHVRFTRNVFEGPGQGVYLNVAGDDAEVDHNELRNKKTLGNMISVTGTGSQVARRLWIHHNYFHDFQNAHGNGAETIRFGLSGLSMSRGEGLVEYNLFVHCTGENELISNKSCANTYRFNTFLDSPGGELSQRHGNDCLIYGNYFRHTQGIRICGDRHQIFSNYLEGCSIGIDIGNGDGEVADGAKLTSHDRPDYCVISFNTLVNNRAQYQLNERKNGMGATHTTFANNIILGGEIAAKIGGAYPDAVWSGNIVWQTKEVGDLPADGFTKVDPLLKPDVNGIYRLQSGSPAMGAGVGSFPKVTVDIDGQPRPEKKTKGANELSSAPVVARLLSPKDVGPAAP
jgi:poly(beta-D-mannuronate) lyase